MKHLTDKKSIAVIFAVCMVVALCAGILLADTAADTASAETISSDLRFNLNSAQTGYTVSALNRQLTEADIPDTYNGLPVTEILNNGFMSCANLVSVTIPKSITKIGSNAFYNCKNLETAVGMAGVTTIGNSAFANCAKLDNLVIPYTVTTLGNYILRNNSGTVYSRLEEEQISSINALWNSNMASEAEIVYDSLAPVFDPVEQDGVTVGYSLREWQLLYAENNYTLYTSYNGLPVLEIQSNAFSTSKCTTLTIKHEQGFNHAVNICSDAFANIQANEVDIEVDVTFNDDYMGNADGISMNIFAGSTITRVTLPDNITFIPDTAFFYCENLKLILSTNPYIEANHLPETVTRIGEYAFQGCTSLPKLYIPSSVVTVGDYAFQDWGTCDQQTICIDRYTPVWFNDWKGDQGDNVNVEYKKNLIVFDADNGFVGTSSVEVSYGQLVRQEAEAPWREHYTFNGYYTKRNGLGTCYYTKDMVGVGVAWLRADPLILYAYWIPETFTIALDNQGGVGAESVTVAYDQPLPSADAPQKDGYVFAGYYEQPNGEGSQYYSDRMQSNTPCAQYSPDTLYAHWIGKEIMLVFDQKGGTGGTYYAAVTYGNPLPANLLAPERENYVFKGYYTEDGVQYFDESMSPVVDLCDFTLTTVLTARWEKQETKVTFYLRNGEPSTTLIIDTGALIPVPMGEIVKRGYTFLGFFDDPEYGTMYIDENYMCVRVCDVEGSLNLYAHWMLTVYRIDYHGISPWYNPNPQTYTIEDLQNGPIVFEDPTDLKPGQTCEWEYEQITLDTLGITSVVCMYRNIELWETMVEENGVIKYYISSEYQFLQLNDENILMGSNVVFYLEQNLRLDWAISPSAYITRCFFGTFEGQGHIITGVTLGGQGYTATAMGLFAYNGSGSVIRNLTVSGTMNVYGNDFCYAGLLCGVNKGVIEDCVVLGASDGSAQQYDVYNYNSNATVGAIVGKNEEQGEVLTCIHNVRFKPED